MQLPEVHEINQVSKSPITEEWGREKIEDKIVQNKWNPDQARMRLGYCVLAIIISVLFFACYANYLGQQGILDKELSITLFEIWKTGLLPIATLILGYYFGQAK